MALKITTSIRYPVDMRKGNSLHFAMQNFAQFHPIRLATTSVFQLSKWCRMCYLNSSMRTFAIILAILAMLAMAAILIAPNLELDDYSDQPFYYLVALLTSFLLQLLSVCDCFRPLNIDLRRRPAHKPRDLWLLSIPVTAAPAPLLC